MSLYKFANKSVIYLARIEPIRPIYKYGISRDIYKRILNGHIKTFPIFQMEHIIETRHREDAEDILTNELKLRGIHHIEKFNGKMNRELIILNNDGEELQEVKELMENIVDHLHKS